MALLAKDCLNFGIFPTKGCQVFLRDFDVLSAIVQTVSFPQFFGQQLEFAFRAPGKFGVRTITVSPAAINVGVAHTHVKRAVTHFHLGSLDGWIAHGFTPVVQVMHPYTDSWLNLCSSLFDRWEGW